jgi:hypothetical protein
MQRLGPVEKGIKAPGAAPPGAVVLQAPTMPALPWPSSVLGSRSPPATALGLPVPVPLAVLPLPTLLGLEGGEGSADERFAVEQPGLPLIMRTFLPEAPPASHLSGMN